MVEPRYAREASRRDEGRASRWPLTDGAWRRGPRDNNGNFIEYCTMYQGARLVYNYRMPTSKPMEVEPWLGDEERREDAVVAQNVLASGTASKSVTSSLTAEVLQSSLSSRRR